ncbi:hypothetical protein GCM10025762_03090 [Haloechinothrix salitolerans]
MAGSNSGSGMQPSTLVARADEVIAELVAAYDAVVAAEQASALQENVGRLRCMYGWWAWINRSSKLLLAAAAAGLEHEAAPNVRSILEHTLALLWVCDEGNTALDAIEAAWKVRQGELYDELIAAGWPVPDDVTRADTVEHPRMRTILKIHRLFVAYDAHYLYIPYRMLSTHVHPSAKGATGYLTDDGLSAQPTRPGNDRVLVALCLMWAAEAMNTVFAGDQLSAAISRVEEILETRVERPQPSKT